MATVRKVVTEHPLRHQWLVYGDYVTMRDEQQITEIRREEHCEHCPRERLSKINVIRWEILSRRYRGENVPLDERTPGESELAAEIAETTTLPELRQQIKRQRTGRR